VVRKAMFSSGQARRRQLDFGPISHHSIIPILPAAFFQYSTFVPFPISRVTFLGLELFLAKSWDPVYWTLVQ
jgi:hypothetical protein